MTGLVVGFGAFREVTDNPSARLANALHGRSEGGLTIVGAELPVSYTRSIELTERLVVAHRPAFILGIGVAVSRDQPELERFGTGRCGNEPDVDGLCRPSSEGSLASGLPLERFAAELGCGISDDAGTYVCNGWLHQAIARFAPVPVGFLHVPSRGVDPRALFAALVTIAPEVG